ncbi:probable sulfate transporter 3.4 [Papaver somniferum]|uniref:probable sulfate transporter 3.4 n=1 Tax=Papaver somniferum TaxID=3469 RepID=UPI000E7060E9|nr:probable sulfate transporter 3.4 [Papaver somniferum]
MVSGSSNKVGDVHETSITIEGDHDHSTTVEIHKVCLPPNKTTFQSIKHYFSEIFFPDDPLHKFKNQKPSKKFFLGLQYFFPILEWGSEYSFKLLKSDVISGLTIASLAIPQGISYAKLANLPPIHGLYSSFVPPLLYAILGSSRHLAVGPVSIASLVMGSMLKEVVSPTEDPTLYLKLALTSTFFAGVFQTSLGLLRLGFIIDFLSKPTLTGFTAGAAVIVGLQQLKGMLGITHFTPKMQIVNVLSSVFSTTKEWSWQTVVMGMCFLIFLLATRHISIKKPQLFWISAAAPLASVILSTALVYAFRAHTSAISIIGHLSKGLNPPSSNMLSFSGTHLPLAVKTGIVSGILSLTEGIAVGRTFASLRNYQIDGNKEMIAIGVMNMAGSGTSCYVTTGSFSRSAVNFNAGAQTAVSNIVMAATVMITLLFLLPLFYFTPNVILAAIIITAVIGLINYQEVIKFWRVDKFDFMTCLIAFFGVLFFSVQMGLAIAVGVSIFKILMNVTRPNTMVLGNIPGTQVFQNVGRYGDATRVPSFFILAIESPICFANSAYLQERILRWVRGGERILENKEQDMKTIILDLTAVTAIDTNGLEAIVEIRKMLDKRSYKLVLVNPLGQVMEKLETSKTLELFGERGLYLTVGEAIADISKRSKIEV